MESSYAVDQTSRAYLLNIITISYFGFYLMLCLVDRTFSHSVYFYRCLKCVVNRKSP